jgi:hypothetical protein
LKQSDEAFVRQEILDAAELNISDLRCPHCQGNTLVLTGYDQVSMRQIRENGEVVNTAIDQEGNGMFDVQRMDCVPCATTYLIRNPELFRLERENLHLKTENFNLRLQVEDKGGTSTPPIPGVGYHH